jgi:prevent-host-death family protein
MSEVPIRELNQNTAAVLARVKSGEPIDITERGTVVARLVPAQEHPLADFIRSGKLTPATAFGPAPRPTGPIQPGADSGALLRTMRDDERY